MKVLKVVDELFYGSSYDQIRFEKVVLDYIGRHLD